MNVEIRVDPSRALHGLAYVEKQVRYATAVALTRAGKIVEAELRSTMAAQFDRPTPWTLRSTYTQPATREKLVAVVEFKNRQDSKNRLTAAQILGHHFTGGERAHKQLELWLMRAGYISGGEFVAPGDGARLDQYGNLSRGQIAQILSQLRAGADPSQYATDSTRSKRNQRRAGVMFWSRGDRLRRGVWMRASSADGSSLKPILMVIKRPTYRRLLNLEEIGVRVMKDRFGDEMRRSLIDALATARR
jgi:hypothetical protein